MWCLIFHKASLHEEEKIQLETISLSNFKKTSFSSGSPFKYERDPCLQLRFKRPKPATV